jgi:hypothetical protein
MMKREGRKKNVQKMEKFGVKDGGFKEREAFSNRKGFTVRTTRAKIIFQREG